MFFQKVNYNKFYGTRVAYNRPDGIVLSQSRLSALESTFTFDTRRVHAYALMRMAKDERLGEVRTSVNVRKDIA